MPDLRQVKRHMQSVASIGKVTNALEVVSTAKALRLQARVAGSRLYAEKSWQVLTHLASATGPELEDDPFFSGYRPRRSVALVLMSSQRGLVGTYNENLLADADAFIAEQYVPVRIITVGRKGREAMALRRRRVYADYRLPEDHVTIEDVTSLSDFVLDGFRDRRFDEVWVAATRSRTGAQLDTEVRRLLPLTTDVPTDRRQYSYEPAPDELVSSLIPRIVRFQLYESYLESLMAENMSRVSAMHTATQNAEDLNKRLTLAYNKARQQAITSEISDLLGGTMGRGRNSLGGR